MGLGVVVDASGNPPVPDEAGQQRDLQGQPVLGLPDVEHESRVCRTCFEGVSLQYKRLRTVVHALMFFLLLQILHGEAMLFAKLDVQFDLLLHVDDLLR